MNLTREKICLGFIACALFISLCVFLIKAEADDIQQGRFQLLTHIILLSFNAIIAASWFAFGWIGGTLFLVVSIIITFSLSLATDKSVYYLHAGALSLTALASFKALRKFIAFQTEYHLKAERAREEANTLSERMARDSAQAEALELKFNRYEELKGVAEYLSDIFSKEKIEKFLTEKSYEIVGKSTRSLVYLVDPAAQELLLVQSMQPDDMPHIKTKKGDIFDKWVLKQNQPLIVLDASKDFRFPRDNILLDEAGFKSLIAVPMISNNKLIGILRLDSRQPNSYNPDDLRLLDIIGDLGAVALYNNMLYQRTTELAIKDGLTHLFVYRYFMERIATEFQRAQKGKHPISVLMIDIDHFKKYNDAHGHIAGDILLKHLASIFTSLASKGDIVARYGGEEFAILLFGEKRAGAKRLAERIRKTVAESTFFLRREVTRATVSIGVSTYPGGGTSHEELLMSADRNLYRAKKEGRDRVCAN